MIINFNCLFIQFGLTGGQLNVEYNRRIAGLVSQIASARVYVDDVQIVAPHARILVNVTEYVILGSDSLTYRRQQLSTADLLPTPNTVAKAQRRSVRYQNVYFVRYSIPMFQNVGATIHIESPVAESRLT